MLCSISNVIYKRGDLNRRLNTSSGQNAHHVNTIENLGNNKVLQDAVDNGFPYNDIENGINLERYSSQLDTPNASIDGTHAYHPNYNKSVDDILKAGTTMSPNGNIEKILIHSEVIALDKAIKARRALNIGFKESDLVDFLLHNRQLIKGKDGVPPRCVNCWHITDGVTVIGNN